MYEFLKKEIDYFNLTFTCFIPTFIAFISMMTPILFSPRLVIDHENFEPRTKIHCISSPL